MTDIEKYEQKKRKLSYTLTSLSFIYFGLITLLIMSSVKGIEYVSDTLGILVIVLSAVTWLITYVDYKNASTKLEIFEELEASRIELEMHKEAEKFKSQKKRLKISSRTSATDIWDFYGRSYHCFHLDILFFYKDNKGLKEW